ncbi:MAG: hypothetical protein E7082_07295 [Bacteroidales bacterium]|nr:hypothetical protein [Bacteroidales bacterium]
METNNQTIKVTSAAHVAIKALQHSAGTYPYYRTTLDRLFNIILRIYDEMGMDDLEAITTLRALDDLRQDLAAIAGSVALGSHAEEATKEEIAGRVEDSFAGIDDFQDSNYPTSTEDA